MIRNSIMVPFEISGHGIFYDKDDFNDVLVKFMNN